MSETIVLKGIGIRKEGIASETITPGQLVALATDGTIRLHDLLGDFAGALFAIENELTGEGIDVDYEVGDNVLYEVLPPGAEVYAWLADSHGTLIGNYVDSNGDGTLRRDITAVHPIGFALEAVDNLASSEPVRIRIEIA